MTMQLTGQTHHGHEGLNVIFSSFPIHPEDYLDDVRGIMDETIEKYGQEEWRLVVLTGELHGHLGIYAIVGAKMGLKAREYFHAQMDEIMIVSHAGSKPPVSCLNDGLQVSTGATVGHGLFSLGNDSQVQVSAEFIYKDRTVTISLKEDLQALIQAEVQDCIKQNQGLTEGYWLDIRKLALKYWHGFNRNEIFIVSE